MLACAYDGAQKSETNSENASILHSFYANYIIGITF